MMTAALVSIISGIITSQQFFLYNSITFISISIASILTAPGFKNTFSAIIIIDSLVNSKFSDLDNTDIQLTMDINIPSQLPFAAADLGITFGNIIDNALEAMSRLQDMPKVIKLFALFDGNSLIITCINTYSGNIVTNSSGELITQKEDASNHGYGIHSIKTIANKYHGAVTTSNDSNTFTIKILLYAS